MTFATHQSVSWRRLVLYVWRLQRLLPPIIDLSVINTFYTVLGSTRSSRCGECGERAAAYDPAELVPRVLRRRPVMRFSTP
jgi:uncharacterized ParB-like nuclease family protein